MLGWHKAQACLLSVKARGLQGEARVGAWQGRGICRQNKSFARTRHSQTASIIHVTTLLPASKILHPFDSNVAHCRSSQNGSSQFDCSLSGQARSIVRLRSTGIRTLHFSRKDTQGILSNFLLIKGNSHSHTADKKRLTRRESNYPDHKIIGLHFLMRSQKSWKL